MSCWTDTTGRRPTPSTRTSRLCTAAGAGTLRTPHRRWSGPAAGCAAFAGAVQGFVRPAKPALRGLECPGRMDLFDVAGVVGDHRERLESQVDPACGCVRVDGAAGVDVGAVDVELEGHPPTPGLLPDRRPD